MSKFIDYIYNAAPILSVDKPSRKIGGLLNDGSYFELGISLKNWKPDNNIPKKKDIVGSDIKFDYDDLDNDTWECYIGTIQGYRFIDSYKNDLILEIGNCKKK